MSKHKYIESPEQVSNIFKEYVKEIKDNPRLKVEYVGRNGDRVNTPIERPLTIEGFLNFCSENYSDINRYFYNVEGKYDDFVSIITRIKNIIRQDQIEGGMTGFYNSNLTARLNGLADKREVEEKGEPRVFNIVRKGLIE